MKVKFIYSFFESNLFPRKIRALEILDLEPKKISELKAAGAEMEILQEDQLRELEEITAKRKYTKHGES